MDAAAARGRTTDGANGSLPIGSGTLDAPPVTEPAASVTEASAGSVVAADSSE